MLQSDKGIDSQNAKFHVVHMNVNSAFIAELIRAANDIDRVSDFEKRRLLDRAVATIISMRKSVGIPTTATTADALNSLTKAAAGDLPPTEVKDALILASGMIRDLQIVIDSETEIFINDGTPANDP